MSHYPFLEIEKKWQNFWDENQTFKTEDDFTKPKYYILDMFPYPSGAGLHVGHPLGYIASDIYSRFKRLQGYNVLHPMGYDSFGLPAEQYAIQTGQHPAKTTDENIKKYRQQLDGIGLSFDWSRSVSTCEPNYYKHTQKTFLDLFSHWYDTKNEKARHIRELISEFEKNGNSNNVAWHNCDQSFSASEWMKFTELQKENILQCFRLAYLADSWVNWCPKLGTVLANDEVRDGLSVRGGHPVEQKKMKQWQLRITAYADRLLNGLNDIDWPEPVKEMQRNWIGKSIGAEITFQVHDSKIPLSIFTTRPDTIFGVSFMAIAPEHLSLVDYCANDHLKDVLDYVEKTKKKTERERLTETKKMTGVFTGKYCIHPWTNEKIPIWVSDYILAGYGTGAIMAVPAHDQRDYSFAKSFKLQIKPIIKNADITSEAYEKKEGILCNSDFLNELNISDGILEAVEAIENKKIGFKKTNFKLRDAIFSRQRYWGEPIPIVYKEGIPKPISETELPLTLPSIDSYLPTEQGEPPLARAKNWKPKDGEHFEFSTMPGFAGSCAYYLRYMDPHNSDYLVDREKNNYWGQVDFYIGGSEHATGHLLYSRFWNNFLFDLGKVRDKEPFKKLFNQGMILGRSNFVYRKKGTNTFVTYSKISDYETQPFHVDVNIVKNDILDIDKFRKWRKEFENAEFILNEQSVYECGVAVEKMSKSFYNVINPETIIQEYGADSFRMYEMFLGPLEQSKPWNTNGLEGVFRFMNKFWRLAVDENGAIKSFSSSPNKDELKVLHTAIKKITNDVESFSLNTCISALMICVNDLSKIEKISKCTLEKLILIMSPFAPHVTEELWSLLGHNESITKQKLPEYNENFLIEKSFNYPISFNGKLKFNYEMDLSLDVKQIESIIVNLEQTKTIINGKLIKKVIVVPAKIVNIVF